MKTLLFVSSDAPPAVSTELVVLLAAISVFLIYWLIAWLWRVMIKILLAFLVIVLLAALDVELAQTLTRVILWGVLQVIDFVVYIVNVAYPCEADPVHPVL
jgi:uncharacterized membrane protein